jgi:hypothetical protein
MSQRDGSTINGLDDHDDATTRDKDAQEQGRGEAEAGRAGGAPTTRSLGAFFVDSGPNFH